MPTKKAVFLFGAGAVLDWKAPSTRSLTELITNIGFQKNDGTRITALIYDRLKKLVAKEDYINFETIINFIEELYNHAYLSKQHNDFKNKAKAMPVPSLYSLVELDDLIAEFTEYEVTDFSVKTGKYSLIIPGYFKSKEDFIDMATSPEEKYFELLINDLLGGIIGHIAQYSYCTQGHNVIFTPENESINKLFVEWIKSFHNNNYSIRMYTLNYDRLFKMLIAENGIDVFEGFNTQGSFAGVGVDLIANIPKIISDFNCNVHYNLHGSAYWRVDYLNRNQLPGYQFFLSDAPIIHSGRNTAVAHLERGRKILLSNIITGYQKVQRTAISPFRQLFAAFDRDCLEADELIIVGYSYGDEHINDIIRNAGKYNSKVKITLVSPSFDDHKIAFDFLLHWTTPKTFLFRNEGDDIVMSNDDKIKAIKLKFGDYLERYSQL